MAAYHWVAPAPSTEGLATAASLLDDLQGSPVAETVTHRIGHLTGFENKQKSWHEFGEFPPFNYQNVHTPKPKDYAHAWHLTKTFQEGNSFSNNA